VLGTISPRLSILEWPDFKRSTGIC